MIPLKVLKINLRCCTILYSQQCAATYSPRKLVLIFYDLNENKPVRWVFVLCWPGAGHRSRGCGERTPNSKESRTRREA